MVGAKDPSAWAQPNGKGRHIGTHTVQRATSACQLVSAVEVNDSRGQSQYQKRENQATHRAQHKTGKN